MSHLAREKFIRSAIQGCAAKRPETLWKTPQQGSLTLASLGSFQNDAHARQCRTDVKPDKAHKIFKLNKYQ